MQNVTDYLKKLGKVGIAFSGGVDSALLAILAQKALGDNAHAFTIITPYMNIDEITAAKHFAEHHHINHHTINIDTPKEIEYNSKDRCYTCKTKLFNALLDEVKTLGISHILDGSNADDTKDYRPGMKALKELNIKSPFLELGITKLEIRSLSKLLKLETWDTPSNPCLLTRLPYDIKVDEKKLRQVERAENFIKSKGLINVRVRHEGLTARIEVPSSDQNKLFQSPLNTQIISEFKDIGFTFVAMDLKPFKSGNMNQTL